MAIDFFESFDGCGTTIAGFQGKGWLGDSRTTITASGRFGNGFLVQEFYGGGTATKQLSRDTQRAWHGFAIKSDVNGHIKISLNYGSNVQATVHVDWQTLLVKLYRGNDAVLIGSTALPADPNVWRYFEYMLFIDGSAGEFQCRMNGQMLVSLTGLNSKGYASSTYVNGLKFNGVAFNNYLDDMYFLNDSPGLTGFQGDSHMYAYNPTADGDRTEWTPNSGTDHYSRVNEAAQDGDTSYNSSSTVGHADLYTGVNLPEGIGPIVALQKSAYARKTDVGTRVLQATLKSGGTEYNKGTFLLSTSYQCWQETFQTDPDTEGPWTRAGANALQFGSRVAV